VFKTSWKVSESLVSSRNDIDKSNGLSETEAIRSIIWRAYIVNSGSSLLPNNICVWYNLCPWLESSADASIYTYILFNKCWLLLLILLESSLYSLQERERE